VPGVGCQVAGAWCQVWGARYWMTAQTWYPVPARHPFTILTIPPPSPSPSSPLPTNAGLTAVLRRLRSHPTLRGKRYYIDFSTVRGGDIVQELERKIARLSRNRPTTQLFTGHIGCGKSTELFRLKTWEKRRNYEVVYFESDQDLEMADVEISDILLSIAHNVSQHLDSIGIVPGPPICKTVSGLANTLRTPMEISDVSFSAGIASITASAKQSPDMRSQLRQYLEPRTKNIINAINNELLTPANEKLQQNGKNRLVVIMDNLDRIDSAQRCRRTAAVGIYFCGSGRAAQTTRLPPGLHHSPGVDVFQRPGAVVQSVSGPIPWCCPWCRWKSEMAAPTKLAGLLRQMVLIRAFPT
jgi:hypothetical protein